MRKMDIVYILPKKKTNSEYKHIFTANEIQENTGKKFIIVYKTTLET